MTTQPRRMRNTDDLIIQLRTDDVEPASIADYHKGSSLADTLEALFYHTSLGVLDGTDTGGGKYNLYINDIAQENWDQASSLVIKELTRKGLLDKAVVARGVAWENDTDEWVNFQVVWPLNYDAVFSIW